MKCSVTYDTTQRGVLLSKVLAYIRNRDINKFFQKFKSGNFDNQVLFTLENYHDLDTNLRSIIDLYTDARNIIDAEMSSRPENTSLLLELLNKIESELHLVVDNTQSTTLESDIESKTQEEIYDKNREDLEEHLKEIYGLDSPAILSMIKSEFYDDINTSVYCDATTGRFVEKTNSVLNANIIKLKNKYLNRIKNFLIQNDIEFVDSFYGVLRTFYKHFKSISDVKDRLNVEYSKKNSLQNKQNQLNEYSQLKKAFENDEHASQWLKNKNFTLNSDLFNGDIYSLSYCRIKEYLSENSNETLLKYIDKIEEYSNTLLSATVAYTMLSQFDNLLVDALGKDVAIQPGTKNIELDNKYSHHQDTSHEIKGWQTSEDISSEKHTAKKVKALFSLIRIFDHKNNTFKNSRLSITPFIMASRHLIDDIIYNKITISGTMPDLEYYQNKLELCITTFHNTPIDNLQTILTLLFDTSLGNLIQMKNLLANKKSLTDYDLDILYSIYKTVFDKKNSSSFYNQTLHEQYNNKASHGLMEEIAAYVQNNVIVDYLETAIDLETNETRLVIKRKFFSDLDLLKLRKNINHQINQKDLNSRKSLQDKYQFQVRVENTATKYSITLDGNNSISFYLANANPTQLMGFPKLNPFAEISNLFDFQDVDLYIFSLKLLNNEPLSANENKLHSILKFIDSYLDLNILTPMGLQTLQTYENIYQPKYGMNNCLMPLFYLATRAAYINYLYIAAGDQRLVDFLKNDNLYIKHKNDPKLKLFVEKFKNVKYVATSYRDFVLETWVNAQALLSGKGSKSTTKDGHGNNIPNSSVGKLGGNIHYQLHKQKNTNCDSLLFVSNPKMITATVYDLEAFHTGKVKSVKNFSCGELFYHSIVNKFWASYVQSGHVIIQPTTYSDKTTFPNWEILPQINDNDLLKDSDYVNKVLQYYTESLGGYYTKVYNDTVAKLTALSEYYNNEHNDLLSYQELLNSLTEEQLIKLRQDYFINKGKIIDLEKDKDYRTLIRIDEEGNKIEYCAFNETLEYYKQLYSNKELLKEALLELKYNFLQDLIDYNTSFLVLSFNDKLDYYTTDTVSSKASKPNSIMNVILKLYSKSSDRIKFFKDWVDPVTGKLILAKLENQNILGIENSFNRSESMVLNPLLDKFFYIEGLFSNNLRMSLTGSEMNHPNKITDTLFDSVKNINDVITFNIKTNFNISDGEFQQIKSILNNCNSVNDLSKYFINPETSVGNILKNIYTKSVIKIINGTQGALFKRNVIIPATLLYVKWEPKNGVSKRIKVAVIYDKKADVFNYRGDEDAVDSSDGSAQINPFQSILENMSLGSQAVGFIKKPIWHGYDSDSGTAFLAKFATTTITNESMRASMYSKTSLFKLFKRMTSIFWDNGKISLTKPIQLDKEYSDKQTSLFNNWFNQTILEGLQLFYENLFGEKIQILSLKKDITSDGKVYYYTEEKSLYGNPIKVYHMFDSNSEHYTFNSLEEALSFTGHTIQSLFELHTSLGSIYCVDSQGKPSEFNNQVVANYMNNVGWIREDVNPGSYVSQKNYEQPLKELHIGYALNNTAVKNGAKNINPSTSWDDSQLNYFEVDSDGLGMQMNADHDIVNSELTEFSQVIAATAAYGYTYDNCNEIFKGLAQTAIQASKQTLDAIEKFLNNFESDTLLNAKSDLYDAIGRIILTQGKINTLENLTNIIKEAVWKIFNTHKNHKDDIIKIPFSDPNIYSDFISTLASTITKDSIKRKHPGSGCVMVPSYDIITYFEIGDKKYSLTEIVKIAKNWFLNELINRLKQLENYNQDSDELDDIDVSSSEINILLSKAFEYNLLSDDEEISYRVQDAVKFNNSIVNQYLNVLQNKQPYFNKEYFLPEDVVMIFEPMIDESGTTITNDVGEILYHEGRKISLDSMLKYYNFKDHNYPNGTKFLLDVKTPRNLKPSLIRWKYVNSEGNETYMNIFDYPVIKNTFVGKGKLDSNYRKNVQKVLHDLHKGFFEIDGIRYNIIPNSLENTEAELIMSNIYLEIFDTEGESLQTILDQGEQYFIKKINYRLNAPLNKIYDLALLKDNGKHTLIRFNPVKPDANCVETPFNNISVDEHDDIYCMKGNKSLFKIGKYIDINDKDIYIDGDEIKSRKEIDKNLYRIKDGRVQKRIDFILRYKVTSKSINKKTHLEFYTTNTLYALSPQSTFEQVYKDSANDEINKLIKDVYNQDNYKFIELNALKSENYIGDRFSQISNYLDFFRTDFNINPDHRNYLSIQLNQLEQLKAFNFKDLSKLKKSYYEKEAHRQWVSFLDSLKFISSRIPAQTLQSFMAMKCVGWVENTKNMAYVSHFLIYLLGSDY